jgi:NAD/NADP transhydrogenase alpha subunit
MQPKTRWFAWLIFLGFLAVSGVAWSDAEKSESIVNTPSDATLTAKEEMGVTKLNRIQVLVGSLTVFTLAVIVGFEIIAKVPPTLHTPLMSGSNAISGITEVLQVCLDS